MANLKVQKVVFRGRAIQVIRDDLFIPELNSIAVPAALRQGLSGNKGRKLHYYLEADLPQIRRLVSYGSAQSNMLYSLSCLAKLKSWQLDFYVDHVPASLEQAPRGNFAAARSNGAHIHPVGDICRAENISLASYAESRGAGAEDLYIPEGGSSARAEQGIKVLASEIRCWLAENSVDNPLLVLPSGTGTTALYLQKYLDFPVLSCACVGSADYLWQQFSQLERDTSFHPEILPTPLADNGQAKKYHFGKCYPEFYAIWEELKQQTGICFELIYDPLGWLCLQEYLKQGHATDTTLMYLHQGGVLGNKSMIGRYKRKGRLG